MPVPAGHLYNKRGTGQIPGGSGGNNNISGHIGGGGGILHGGAKGQRQPFLQRLPSRIHHLTRAIEMAVTGAANPTTQQQQQQRQHAQAKQVSLKSSKPNNNHQAGNKKLQQSEKA
ncbi:hypothetical protein DMN91_008149 [Ooceraea biroi]|uniref:Uncharacterized protein n=1 Tax=Ooceraea biroi TaxID=2015173 RepID=A0A3L8DHD0_OOCBI|nr:hypothetical protein DMN91_008149 [Ooceraea biroi]